MNELSWKISQFKEVLLSKTFTKNGRHCSIEVSVLDSGPRGLGLRPGHCNMLCSQAKHCTLTVHLSTQEYKLMLTNCQGRLMKGWG